MTTPKNSRKTRHELEDENHALRLALENVLNVIEQPGRYHHRLIYSPEAAPRRELNPPGLRGLQAIVIRAKSILARTQGS